MRLSIRNQLDATIEAVTRGEVMGTIRTRLTGGQQVTAAITLDAIDDLKLDAGQPVTVLLKGQTLTSAITKDAAEDLGLTSGDAVTVLVKATEVSIAVE